MFHGIYAEHSPEENWQIKKSSDIDSAVLCDYSGQFRTVQPLMTKKKKKERKK